MQVAIARFPRRASISEIGWISGAGMAESAAVPSPVDWIRAAPDAVALDQLERRLDRVPFRATARWAARWQARPRHAKPARPIALPRAEETRHASSERLLQALAEAWAGGALESAERFVGELRSRGIPLPGAGAITLVVETLLMLGKREEARELAQAHTATLSESAAGLAALELSGVDAGRDWLPGARPHLLRLSRRIGRGQLTAADLARLLPWKPHVWLREPELHLLFVNALVEVEPERAMRFLDRFLRLYGASCDGLDGGDPNVLGRLRLARARITTPQRKLVSVIVAAHDAAATAGYAISSLLEQSYRNLEILVGDDASRDSTLELLRRRFGAEPRVRLFRSSRNQGAYNIRNALAQHARGELLTFHDADDFALPNRIASQVEQLEQPSVRACVGNFVRVTPSGSFVFFKDQRASRLCAVSLMLTRSAFDEVGPFRSARFGADLELFVELRQRFGVEAVRRLRTPLLLGLATGGSATRTAGAESLEDGYRSPARRAYSELIFWQHQPRGTRLTNEELDARLRATDNYQQPSELSKA